MSAATVELRRESERLVRDTADLVTRTLAAIARDDADAVGRCAPTPARLATIGELVGAAVAEAAAALGGTVEAADCSRAAVRLHVAPQFNHALVPSLESAFFGSVVFRAAAGWLEGGGVAAAALADKSLQLARRVREILSRRVAPPAFVTILPDIK